MKWHLYCQDLTFYLERQNVHMKNKQYKLPCNKWCQTGLQENRGNLGWLRRVSPYCDLSCACRDKMDVGHQKGEGRYRVKVSRGVDKVVPTRLGHNK